MDKNGRNQKTKTKTMLFLFLLSILFMFGCGKDTELENYKVNMNQFFENIKIYDASINAIDPDSEAAVSELLRLLDSMDVSFAQMASLNVPEEFRSKGVDQLAADASKYMSEAVSYYHQAYDGTYNANLESAAYQNYERANIRLQYIVSIIHGNIPEEIYTYDDDNGEDMEMPPE